MSIIKWEVTLFIVLLVLLNLDWARHLAYLNIGSVLLAYAASVENDAEMVRYASEAGTFFGMLSSDSNNPSLQLLGLEALGKAQWVSGNPANELTAWNTLAESGKLSSINGFMLGLRYWESGNRLLAVQTWRAAHIPADAILNLRARYRAEPNRLSDLAEVALMLNSVNDSTIRSAALDYELWGMRVEAASLWSAYAQGQPSTTAEYWYAAGQAAYLSERFDDAVTLFTEGRERWPGEARFPERLVSVFSRTGQIEKAIETAIPWAESFPETAAIAYQQLGELAFAKGDLSSAKEWWSKSIELQPNNAYVWWRFGEVALSAANYEDAKRYYETAISANREMSEAYRGLALVLYAMGDIDLAIAKMEEAIERYQYAGCLASWYKELGAWYAERGDLGSAKQMTEAGEACLQQ